MYPSVETNMMTKNVALTILRNSICDVASLSKQTHDDKRKARGLNLQYYAAKNIVPVLLRNSIFDTGKKQNDKR